LEALTGLVAGTLRAEPQDDAYATYAHKLEKQESQINWEHSAGQIDRQVRAFNPWPVAQTTYQGKPLRIWQAEVLEQSTNARPGVILTASKAGIDVATGQAQLRVLRLQMPGKRVVSAGDFLNAHAVDGVVLG
jgi:methionyl-tRNA formyltransferase